MNRQWEELKETIIELRDNNGTCTQQEVCKFLANYMEILEKQMQEPAGDAVNRQAVFNIIERELYKGDAISEIEKLPSANLQEQRTGHWINADRKPNHLQNGMTTESVWCSECGKWLAASDEYSCDGKFCPNCGVRMESEDKG